MNDAIKMTGGSPQSTPVSHHQGKSQKRILHPLSLISSTSNGQLFVLEIFRFWGQRDFFVFVIVFVIGQYKNF